jgi:hypothetical protein
MSELPQNAIAAAFCLIFCFSCFLGKEHAATEQQLLQVKTTIYLKS